MGPLCASASLPHTARLIPITQHSTPFSSPFKGRRRSVGRPLVPQVLKTDYFIPSHDNLDTLLVPREHFELLSKQLEKLNWAVLVNETAEAAVDDQDQDKAAATPRTTDEGYVYHFAYGANMNFYTLARRDVRALSRDPAKLVNPRYRMVFKHRGGFATVEEVLDDSTLKYCPFSTQVHGVLYRITNEDLKKLQQREGGYMLKQMQVETYDQRLVTAWVFVSARLAKLRQEVVPTEKYMRKLREGASDNYLDPLYQAWLSSIETVSSAGLPQEYFNTPSKYFAYGFLCIVACILSGFFFKG